LKISKGFVILCILVIAGYAWHQHQKVDEDVSESGFVEVGDVAGVYSNIVTVVGPT